MRGILELVMNAAVNTFSYLARMTAFNALPVSIFENKANLANVNVHKELL